MSVRAPAYFAIGALALTLCGAAAGGLLLLWKSTVSFESVFLDRVKPMADLKLASDSYAIDIARAPSQLLQNQIEWPKAGAIVAQARDAASKYWGSYLQSYIDPAEKLLVAEAVDAIKNADPALDELSTIFAARDRAQLEQFVARKLYPAVDPVRDALTKLVAHQVAESQEEYRRSQDMLPLGQWIIGFSVLLGLAYLLFVGKFIAREHK